MIPEGQLIVLDTNIAVHYVRASQLGADIELRYKLRSRLERPILCIVTVGELLSLAMQLNWSQTKKHLLLGLIREFAIVDINDQGILDCYATIDVRSKSIGRKMGKNDLWIAASAASLGAHVLTTDRDFQVIGDLISVHWIDPAPPTDGITVSE